MGNQKIKRMSVKEFRTRGFLQEVNRQFLHPLGLALETIKETEDEESFGEVWDYIDDPEGMFFGDVSSPDMIERAEEIEKLKNEKAEVRIEKYGFSIQPLGHSFVGEEIGEAIERREVNEKKPRPQAIKKINQGE